MNPPGGSTYASENNVSGSWFRSAQVCCKPLALGLMSRQSRDHLRWVNICAQWRFVYGDQSSAIFTNEIVQSGLIHLHHASVEWSCTIIHVKWLRVYQLHNCFLNQQKCTQWLCLSKLEGFISKVLSSSVFDLEVTPFSCMRQWISVLFLNRGHLILEWNSLLSFSSHRHIFT